MSSLRALIIDDDEFMVGVIRVLLEESGSDLELVWEGDWERGLARLLAGGVDACLLDYQLGERSGVELLRAAHAKGCRTPVVMLTALSRREIDLEAMHAGAVDYLVKGEFTGHVLERVVRYAAERANTLERLRESEERYALAIAGTNDGIWDLKVAQGSLFLSPRFKYLLGASDDELPSTLDAWLERIHDGDRERIRTALQRHIDGELAVLDLEGRLRHQDGGWRWCRLRANAVRDGRGMALRVAGSLTDVTQARGRDLLTGLFSRELFIERLDYLIARARRAPENTYAALFIDCDRFKVVNDSLGHVVGDELLVQIGRRIEGCVRTVDTVARFGGDEFAVLLDEPREPDGAMRVGERIVEALSQAFTIDGKEVFSGASVGVALSKVEYRSGHEVLRDADTAMYRAKALGRGRVAVFDEQMHQRALTTLRLDGEMRRGLPLGQFQVFYQPVFETRDRDLLGFEALVRWKHPERGMVAPDVFLGLAEETGFVSALDRFVLESVCKQLLEWQRDFPKKKVQVAVNASRAQLERAGAADHFLDVVREHGLPTAAVAIEVTESVVMDHPQVLGALVQLKEAGVRVMMDDFGTGYSSLANLHRLPFHAFKMDRGFVLGLSQGPGGVEVAKAIVTLGRGLGLDVIAEGVETEAQLGALRELGCRAIQGYLLGRPGPADQATAHLQRAVDGGAQRSSR